MGISPNTINEINEVVIIEEVIGDFVDLKKAGKNFKGFSPFSEERSPSFMVSPDKGIFKDFSSGKGGNAISFLIESEGYSYVESLEYLANKYNIEIEYTQETLEDRVMRNSKRAALNEARRFYFQQGMLPAKTYMDAKGFSDSDRSTFQIGYAYGFHQQEHMSLLQHMRGLNFPLESLVQANLITLKSSIKDRLEKNNQSLKSMNWDDYRDTFFERLIFPLSNHMGKTVGFSGRVLPFSNSPSSHMPKYTNTADETPFGKSGYNKSSLLYGLHEAKSLIRKSGYAVVSEGYTDVIHMQKYSLPAVGTGGTAFTYGQGKLLSRFTKNVVNIFDGDKAGLKAVINALLPQYKAGLSPRIIFLPDGEDPDSYLHKNPDSGGFQELELYNSLEAFVHVRKKQLKTKELDFHQKWELLEDAFSEYFRWHEDKAAVLFGLTEFSKYLDIEPAVALEKYKRTLYSFRNETENELFYPSLNDKTSTLFICNLFAYLNTESQKVYVKNFINDVPKNKKIFKPYQLEIMQTIQEEFLDAKHDAYAMNIQLPTSQVNLFDSVVTPLTILDQWHKAEKISEFPLDEITTLKKGLRPDLENVSKLLHTEYRNALINESHHSLLLALEQQDSQRAEDITQGIEKLYYDG